jgi:hypothetical protein
MPNKNQPRPNPVAKPRMNEQKQTDLSVYKEELPTVVSTKPVRFSFRCRFCEEKREKDSQEIVLSLCDFLNWSGAYEVMFVCVSCQAPVRYVYHINQAGHDNDEIKIWTEYVKQEMKSLVFKQNTSKTRYVAQLTSQ